ncbi:MAG: TonB-dependent receptor [Ferruginibacter sp.]
MLKLKYSFLILVFLFSGSFLYAQNALTGTVISAKSGLPVYAASVSVNDLKLTVLTDTSGKYAFKNLPNGNFIVQVQSVGYKSAVQNILFKSSAVKDFQMQENIVEENEVVVTGMSKATQIKRNPLPIISISHAAMLSNINTNIIDAITKVPGVTAVTTGPNVSKPYIRGLGFNRILTLYDGVRQEGQQWGDEHGIEVDQYSIDRVEVIKGPASLSYGSDALAGVINLIPTQPAPERKIIGDLTTEYQTNNGMPGGSAMLGGTKNGFEWMGRFSDKAATNYQNKVDGRVYGTGFKERDGNVYLGTHGRWGFSHLSFSVFDDTQKIPDGSRDSATGKFTKQITEDDIFRPIVSDEELKSYAITGTYQHVRHYRLYSNNSFTLGKAGRLGVNLAYQNSHRQEFSHPEELNIPGLDLNLNTYNYDVKYFAPEVNGWNLTFGVNGMYQKNAVEKGTEFIIPSYHQFDIGPFAYLKKTINKIDISGGLRYDSRQFTGHQLYTMPNAVTGFDTPVSDTAGADFHFGNTKHHYQGLSGSVGFTYNANSKLSFKFNVARGYRAPDIAEISSDGVHPGTNSYQIGGDNFKPEFSLQEDIGMVYATKHLVFNLSLFNNTITNYIFNQKLLGVNGEDSVIIAPNQTFKFQQGKANLYGGEMNIDIHPLKNLHFENSFSAVYALNKSNLDGKTLNDSSKYLPSIPPFHGLSELRYDINCKEHHIINGFIKAQVVYYTIQNRVYLTDNTETVTPGYALFNCGLGTGISNKAGKTMFNVYLMANNLFNVSYYDHLSRLKYFVSDADPLRGIHNMGRNFSFKVDIPLSFNY